MSTETTTTETAPIIACMSDVRPNNTAPWFDEIKQDYVKRVNGLYSMLWPCAKSKALKRVLDMDMERYHRGYVDRLLNCLGVVDGQAINKWAKRNMAKLLAKYAELAEQPQVKPTPNIVIHISGGVVQGITSDSPINVLLDEEDTFPKWGYPVDFDQEYISEMLQDPDKKVGAA